MPENVKRRIRVKNTHAGIKTLLTVFYKKEYIDRAHQRTFMGRLKGRYGERVVQLTERSFTHLTSILWNTQPKHLRQPSPHQSFATDCLSVHALSLSHQCHFQLKTFLLHLSFLPIVCAENSKVFAHHSSSHISPLA